MKAVKLGTMVVATLLMANSFAQQTEKATNKSNVKKEANSKQKLTPEERAKIQTERLDKQIGLTADQKNKIYETNLAINNKNEAVQKHPTWTPEIKNEALQGNNAGREELINSYLTEEQRKKYAEIKARKAAEVEMAPAKKENNR
ncbi:MAG: hypothetical protein WC044_09865 [Crocinitomicaceae bacterium]